MNNTFLSHAAFFDKLHLELASKASLFSRRDPEKKRLIEKFAETYGVSTGTVYRRLAKRRAPGASMRSDSGIPRSLSMEDMKKYCRIIAAMKLKTENKKGRHPPIAECIRLLEKHGLRTAEGLVKAPPGKLKSQNMEIRVQHEVSVRSRRRPSRRDTRFSARTAAFRAVPIDRQRNSEAGDSGIGRREYPS